MLRENVKTSHPNFSLSRDEDKGAPWNCQKSPDIAKLCFIRACSRCIISDPDRAKHCAEQLIYQFNHGRKKAPYQSGSDLFTAFRLKVDRSSTKIDCEGGGCLRKVGVKQGRSPEPK